MFLSFALLPGAKESDSSHCPTCTSLKSGRDSERFVMPLVTLAESESTKDA